MRLLQQVGIPRTVQYAKSLGVGDVPAVPSLALGSGEVTLQTMTAPYAAFANHGLVPEATLIRRVEDLDGRVLYQSKQNPVRAISDTTAFFNIAGTGKPGRLIEMDATAKIFSNPSEKATEDYISGRFG